MLLSFEFRGLRKGPRSIIVNCCGVLLNIVGPFWGSKMALQSRLGNKPKQAPRTPATRPEETLEPTVDQKRTQNYPQESQTKNACLQSKQAKGGAGGRGA